MSKVAETFEEDEHPLPLATLGDVQRALAKTIRQARKGAIELPMAHMMINGLGSLAGMMQDARDSRWTQRTRVLWEERAAKGEAKSAEPEANH